ncbi:unnamed protein product [Linum trigynum]|uniref:Uncharacterized protein n=1 Tax=Linum trigynum TaxID=586398 RepID=A0AAV2FUB0_9ROSI
MSNEKVIGACGGEGVRCRSAAFLGSKSRVEDAEVVVTWIDGGCDESSMPTMVAGMNLRCRRRRWWRHRISNLQNLVTLSLARRFPCHDLQNLGVDGDLPERAPGRGFHQTAGGDAEKRDWEGFLFFYFFIFY